MSIKLNIGSHNKRVKGFYNVDALELEQVDYVCDITETPWRFRAMTNALRLAIGLKVDSNSFDEKDLVEENDVEEILMVEVLEHISWRKTSAILKECYRVLKPGGKLHIQVPDCGSMMRSFYEERVGEEIPHKGDEIIIKRLQEETGTLVHPDRFLFAFVGAQKHEYDYHRNIFWQERLEWFLDYAGFKYVKIEDKLGWKLKYNCFKPEK